MSDHTMTLAEAIAEIERRRDVARAEAEAYAAGQWGIFAESARRTAEVFDGVLDLLRRVRPADAADDEDADPLIAGRTVISEPGAAIEVVELELTPRAERWLRAGVGRLPPCR